MKEIKPLTSLRALAALMVFMYHYAWLFPPSDRGVVFTGEWVPFRSLWSQGQVGVAVFFVLSGFLITRIYFDQMARGEIPLRLFFVKRIARIWPLYLCFVIIQHGVLWHQGNTPDASWLVTMSMTQGFFSHLRYDGLPTAWSLTIEESFYVFAPLLYFILARTLLQRRGGVSNQAKVSLPRLFAILGITAIGLLAVGQSLVWSTNRWGWHWQGFMDTTQNMIHATIAGRFPEFAIGVVAAFIHRGWNLKKYLAGHRADILAMMMFLGIGCCMHGLARLSTASPIAFHIGANGLFYLLAIFVGFLILALTVPGGMIHKILSLPLLVFLGKISYGFYLIQLSVLIAPMVRFSDHLGWARLPALFLMTNVFCASVYMIVEKPARRMIISRWGGNQPRRQT